MGGYKGKILEVNLTTGAISHSTIDEDVLRKFIGGSGLAAKLFLDRVPPDVDALSAENILFVMNGPITGTGLPGSARISVCAKSPLTNMWGESSCGGFFGPELRFAGYDGIAIKGVSPKPVYLLIDDDKVEICDASDLWGKDTYDVTDLLYKKVTGTRKPRVLVIGPAGENLVRFAGIVSDKADLAARCGMGAVMGSKKLKAIVARGTGKVEPGMPDGFVKKRKEIMETVKTSMVAWALKNLGTNAGMAGGVMTGDTPSKNWALGLNLGALGTVDAPTMNRSYLTKAHACYACPIASKRVCRVAAGPYKIKEGPGPEYETCASFGTLLLNNDMAAIIKANELCNRHGMDTISCGAAIAFALDCLENGLISRDDVDGVQLEWGNASAVLQMVDKIAKRDGFGDTLAEGTRRAAEKIGGNAADYTIEVKGLDLPMHDPRANHALGITYATSVRGACHVNSGVFFDHSFVSDELGVPAGQQPKESEGKAARTIVYEDLGRVVNSAGVCWFTVLPLNFEGLLEELRITSGFDYDLKEMMECGARIWMLQRGLSNLMGITAADDRLPKRIMTAHKEGGAAGSVPDLKLMLKDYYRLRPLNANGRPPKEKLQSLGLSELAARL